MSIRDIQGEVVDENGDPVGGAYVTMRYHVPNGGTNSRGLYHYDSTTTNASGKYHFNRRKKIAWEHWLIVRHPSYKTQWFNLVADRNPTTLKLNYPVGYISIRVKKRTSGSSKIFVEGDAGSYSCQNSFNYDSLVVNSKVLFANRSYTIFWTVNDTISLSKTVILEKAQNYLCNIEYD